MAKGVAKIGTSCMVGSLIGLLRSYAAANAETSRKPLGKRAGSLRRAAGYLSRPRRAESTRASGNLMKAVGHRYRKGTDRCDPVSCSPFIVA